MGTASGRHGSRGRAIEAEVLRRVVNGSRHVAPRVPWTSDRATTTTGAEVGLLTLLSPTTPPQDTVHDTRDEGTW